MAEKNKPLIFKWQDNYLCTDANAINYCRQSSPSSLIVYGPTHSRGIDGSGDVMLPISGGKLPNGQSVDEFYKDQNLATFHSFAMFSREKEPETLAVRVENIRTLSGQEDNKMIKVEIIFDNLEFTGVNMEKAEFERLAQAVEASKQQQAARTWVKGST